MKSVVAGDSMFMKYFDLFLLLNEPCFVVEKAAWAVPRETYEILNSILKDLREIIFLRSDHMLFRAGFLIRLYKSFNAPKNT